MDTDAIAGGLLPLQQKRASYASSFKGSCKVSARGFYKGAVGFSAAGVSGLWFYGLRSIEVSRFWV